MINKQAQPANWQKILSGLRNVKNIPSKTLGYINNPSMFSFEQSADNPKAVAYVTNEDYNNDGRADFLKVHIVVPTFNSAFRTSDLASMAEDSPEFQNAISRIADVLVHEVEGHVKDFNPNNPDNPFAGGEAVAESAERAFEAKFANDVSRANKMMKKDIFKLANHLDYIGRHDIASKLDEVLKII